MTASRFANRPEPPYYAVIFTSQHKGASGAEYAATAKRMFELAAQQPGYIGVESTHGADGFGITVSYFTSLEAIAGWRKQAEHMAAQERGRTEWYSGYEIRIAKVERAYGFRATAAE